MTAAHICEMQYPLSATRPLHPETAPKTVEGNRDCKTSQLAGAQKIIKRQRSWFELVARPKEVN